VCKSLIHFYFFFSFQVYIVGHMPPGSDERQIGIIPNGHTTYSEKNNLRYLRLVRKYSSIIQGQFFGHLHSDSFRIVYNDMGKIFLSSLDLHTYTLFLSPIAILIRFIHSNQHTRFIILYNFVCSILNEKDDALSVLKYSHCHFFCYNILN